MAVCKIKSIHRWKNKTVTQTLAEVIAYARNEIKTTYTDKNNVQKKLASAFQCEDNAAEEWFLLKKLYKKQTGRDQGDKDILAYRIIQSFDPKEDIDPELANKIGYEMAERLTGGKFSFVVGTHLDKEHTHNHIVINSTSLEATYKYRDEKRSFERIIKKLNDELCKKYGVTVLEDIKNTEKNNQYVSLEESEASDSVGEVSKPSGKTQYIHWLNENRDKQITQDDKPTWQNILRQLIDLILGRTSKYAVLNVEEINNIQDAFIEAFKEKDRNKIIDVNEHRPKDLNEFIQMLKICGYEVKGLENKYISVKAKGQRKFTRLNPKTLGDEYTKQSIIDYIESYSYRTETATDIQINVDTASQYKARLDKIIDVQHNQKAQASIGYEKWLKLKNLKTLADTHSYLAANDLIFADVMNMVSEKENTISALKSQKGKIQRHTDRQKEIGELQNHLISYVKNRKVFDEYKKSGYNKTFKEENAEGLADYKQAKKYFDSYKLRHGIDKLPSMKELRAEYAELKKLKSAYYDELKEHNAELKLLSTLKANTMELLGVDENGNNTKTEKEIERERKELIKVQKERLAKESKYKNWGKSQR